MLDSTRLFVIDEELFSRRYIFNVGEGAQRLAHEHRIKISRLEHVFVTQAVWENIGGLLGFALTLQECGVPMVTLHGPDRLVSSSNLRRLFIFVFDNISPS